MPDAFTGDFLGGGGDLGAPAVTAAPQKKKTTSFYGDGGKMYWSNGDGQWYDSQGAAELSQGGHGDPRTAAQKAQDAHNNGNIGGVTGAHNAAVNRAVPQSQVVQNPQDPFMVTNAPPSGSGDFSYSDPGAAVSPAQNPAAPPPATQETAPQMDRTKVDQLLVGVQNYANQIAALGNADPALSEGLAQLQRGLEQTRAQALSLARSGSSRDRGALVGQAIAEGSAAASRASQDAAALRSQEEERDRQFKMQALKTAGDMGMNTAVLEKDISAINLDSVSNIVNQEFQQYGLDKQISQQEAESLRGYARDMQGLGLAYQQLSSEEQRFLSDQLAKKWQLQGEWANRLELARMSKPDEPKWYEKILPGAVSGLATAGATALLSDETAKTDISWGAEDELQSLLTSIRPAGYRYRDKAHGKGRYWGPMAQDLLKSELGRALVIEDGGPLQVDGGRAGLTALGAAAALDARLRRLESGARGKA